jgi:outer membrane protein assembly factor BamB
MRRLVSLQGWNCPFLRNGAFMALTLASSLLAVAQVSVTTYHYDHYRTGLNSQETVLTPKAVHSSSFGVLSTVPLDDQVDAQPLVVPNVNITAGNYQGIHTVVYVATDNNSIYAVDTTTGTVLLQANFGPPVVRPLGCGKNNPDVGINSTPVIDLASNSLYVVVYTQQSTGPAYFVHALDLGSLIDKVTPQLVTGSHTLTNATTFTFNAKYQRQRPALLLASGNVYAAFGSFCDLSPNQSRGWVLGWKTGSLTPLPGNQLMDTQATDTGEFFLSSIWMSGYGPAADDSGNLLFVTGNSDPSGTTYDGVTNIQESVVEVSPDLTTVLDLFTPDNVGYLDEHDLDFGSGGVMVLPDQPGSIPNLAVAAGKVGSMFFMNESDLGGYSTETNNVLGTYPIGDCWCGPSYFVDPKDGAARVVSSGGSRIIVWKLLTSPAPSLTEVARSPILYSAGNGFFTSVSSNGTANPIIWALARPKGNQTTLSLYAFDPDLGGTTMKQLFLGTAGAWVADSSNSNLVPVVANGEVFVASYKELVILGLEPQGKAGKK